MSCPKPGESFGSCKYSLATEKKCLVKCALGRGVLRTRESWCESWQPIQKPIWSEL